MAKRSRTRGVDVLTPIKMVRLQRRLLQRDVAARLGVSQQTYSKYESGVVLPDPATRTRIAQALGVAVRVLWPRRAMRPQAAGRAEARA